MKMMQGVSHIIMRMMTPVTGRGNINGVHMDGLLVPLVS